MALLADLPLETLSESDPALERDPGPPQPHLFRIFECNHPLVPTTRHCLGGLDSVVIGRGERRCDRNQQIGHQLRLSIPDPWMSSTHARLFRRDGAWFIEDAGSRNGTLVNEIPADRVALTDGDILECGRTFFLFRLETASSRSDPPDLEASLLAPEVVELASLSPPLAQQLRRLIEVADSSISIVVQGETGTGKERIARAIHVLSRCPGELVAVDCSELPEAQVEAELFGCKRGAFTGAQDRPGLVRTAEHGTLFLDEVGHLPLPAQAALLRTLQERHVHPVGATHPIPVDFRLITANQQPLEELVEAGRFRADLLARLAGVTVQLPPLRERREDFGIITANLLRRLVPDLADSVAFDKEATRALLRHPFPLNIRELEKGIEKAVILASGGPIRLQHLTLDMLPSTPVLRTLGSDRDESLTPEDVALRSQLIALLDEHGGNLSAAARVMGKQRVQIRRWLRRYRIDPSQFRR